MIKSPRSIFRPEVVQRYVQEREKAVLPRFISSRIFLLLWLLFGLFLLGGSLLAFKKIPVYASCSAVVIRNTFSPTVNDSIVLAVFFPVEMRTKLKVGLPLLLKAEKKQVTSRIKSVEPEVLDPETALQRFALQPKESSVVPRPSVLAVAGWGQELDLSPSTVIMGKVYRAEVEIGTVRLISLMPLVGKWGSSLR